MVSMPRSALAVGLLLVVAIAVVFLWQWRSGDGNPPAGGEVERQDGPSSVALVEVEDATPTDDDPSASGGSPSAHTGPVKPEGEGETTETFVANMGVISSTESLVAEAGYSIDVLEQTPELEAGLDSIRKAASREVNKLIQQQGLASARAARDTLDLVTEGKLPADTYLGQLPDQSKGRSVRSHFAGGHVWVYESEYPEVFALMDEMTEAIEGTIDIARTLIANSSANRR